MSLPLFGIWVFLVGNVKEREKVRGHVSLSYLRKDEKDASLNERERAQRERGGLRGCERVARILLGYLCYTEGCLYALPGKLQAMIIAIVR